ncbi:MAG: esterase [Candidatus Cloacimonadota bacterium]|nr:MAG: esterase [Candidatus Cloacimonadota bacterium]
MNTVKQESIFLDFQNYKLHLRKIYKNENDPAVLMVHGAIENGKIFYTKKNKGFAPFLASKNYCCYVIDLRGRGESSPLVSKDSKFGQTQIICEDLPFILDELLKNHSSITLVAHSWGGVLLNSFLCRFPKYIDKINTCIYFASKRSITVNNLQAIFYMEIVWRVICPLLSKIYGYLPAKQFGLGSDNESKLTHYESLLWARILPWIDPQDSFDYGSAIKTMKLPKTLYLTGIKDMALGHPIDVKRFLDESGVGIKKSVVLSKSNGNKNDYDHINILTSKDSVNDHFLEVLKFIEE